MSSTPIDDYEDLTSCHFLLGQSSFNQSPGDFNDSQTNLRTKWKAVQADTIMFWSRSTNSTFQPQDIEKCGQRNHETLTSNIQ